MAADEMIREDSFKPGTPWRMLDLKFKAPLKFGKGRPLSRFQRGWNMVRSAACAERRRQAAGVTGLFPIWDFLDLLPRRSLILNGLRRLATSGSGARSPEARSHLNTVDGLYGRAYVVWDILKMAEPF